MKVVKAGMLDLFQDKGRFGYAQFGVAPGGCMDWYAGRLANLLAGNPEGEAVLEMHFPAPTLEFIAPVFIALAGADFGARVGGIPIPTNRRVLLPAGSTLGFVKKGWGQRCYLAVKGGWQLGQVMGSFSTHLKAGFGGYAGRALKAGDFVHLKGNIVQHHEITMASLSKWFVPQENWYHAGKIRAMKGPEWEWLTEAGRHILENGHFTIHRHSDRMGYQLQGLKLKRKVTTELLSSAVLPGTIQLLPNGQPLILMADCQTTGGYPRVMQVIEADMPVLAQKGPGDAIGFELVSRDMAIDLRKGRFKGLGIVQSSVGFANPNPMDLI